MSARDRSDPGPIPAVFSDPAAAASAPGLDLAGIAASTLCALHCLLGPAVLALAPALGRFWNAPLTHWAIALVVAPVALLAVWRGSRVHGRRWLLPPTALAVALIVAALIVPPLLEAAHDHAHDHDYGHAHHHDHAHGHDHGHATGAHHLETVLTVAGSALLLAVHGVNLQGCLTKRCVAACRRCDAPSGSAARPLQTHKRMGSLPRGDHQ